MVLLWEPLDGRDAHELGRKLLTQALGGVCPPILKEKRGKPYFADDPRHFSISHTRSHVFVAVSDRNIGIDAEECSRPVRPSAPAHLLSDTEYARYLASPDRDAAFLRLWVQKEAAAKLTGRGVDHSVNTTDFYPDAACVRIIDGCFVAIMEE